jgi:hypothetical protein
LPEEGFLDQIATRFRLPTGAPVAAADLATVGPLRRRGLAIMPLVEGMLAAMRHRATLPAPVLLLAGSLLATASDLQHAVAGVRALLAPGGVAVFEVPDLLAHMAGNRFDLLSHAVPAWPSLLVAELVLGQHGLVPFEVTPIPGGEAQWLRLLVRHQEDRGKPVTESIFARRDAERGAGLEGADAYRHFADQVAETRLALLDLLVAARRSNRRVIGIGDGPAAVRLALAAGLGPDLLDATLGMAAGRVLPGCGIPVIGWSSVAKAAPDLVVILDATPAKAVAGQLAALPGWAGRIAAPLPEMRLL